MRFFRHTYKFTHPKTESPIIIKAWSEKGAWKKFHNEIVIITHGKWALSYNASKVNRIVNESRCEALTKAPARN